MGKKNTLLYLDNNLVKLAKKTGINISQVTEEALKSRLKPFLAVFDKSIFLPYYLEHMEKEGNLFFLPFELKRVKLENIKQFKELEIEFSPGLNMILGRGGTGKSNIVRAIAKAFGFTPEYWDEKNCIKQLETKGKIEIVTKKAKNLAIKFEKKGELVITKRGGGCLLLDDAISALAKDSKQIQEFLKSIKKEFKNFQIILTARKEEVKKLKEVDKIIELK